MKIVLLETSSRGMTHHAAGQEMAAARVRCGNNPGGLVRTTPTGAGLYCCAFMNKGHADEFIRYLDDREIEHSVLDPNELDLPPVTSLMGLADALEAYCKRRR